MKTGKTTTAENQWVARVVVQNPNLDILANDMAQVTNKDLREAVMTSYLGCAYNFVLDTYMRFVLGGALQRRGGLHQDEVQRPPRQSPGRGDGEGPRRRVHRSAGHPGLHHGFDEQSVDDRQHPDDERRLMTIVATGVVKSYRTRSETILALRGIDLTIATGEMLAVVGPSGSGKTTMLNCLSGLDHVDAGQVIVDGVDLAALGDGERRDYRAAAMGFLFQGSALLAALTAEENVELPLLIGRGGAGAAAGASTCGSTTPGRRHEPCSNASASATGVTTVPSSSPVGSAERVALARAVVTRPAILWADEPTVNLDSETSAGVMAVIGELHRDGLTVVVVTHDPTVAAAADRKVEVRDGLLDGGPGAEHTSGRTR